MVCVFSEAESNLCPLFHLNGFFSLEIDHKDNEELVMLID